MSVCAYLVVLSGLIIFIHVVLVVLPFPVLFVLFLLLLPMSQCHFDLGINLLMHANTSIGE